MGFWGKGREQIFTEAINYYTINQVGVNRHGGTAVFCRQTKDLMVKCSQTCGAPQAVLLHGKIRSRRILSLRLLYHTSPTPATLSPLFLMNSREFLSYHIYGRI